MMFDANNPNTMNALNGMSQWMRQAPQQTGSFGDWRNALNGWHRQNPMWQSMGWGNDNPLLNSMFGPPQQMPGQQQGQQQPPAQQAPQAPQTFNPLPLNPYGG